MSAQLDAPIGGGEIDSVAHPWLVETRHKGGATAGVTVTADGLLVFVSESPEGSSGTMARLSPDGSAELQCVRAPQALFVGANQNQLVPTLPGLTEGFALESSDDAIVLCTAGVLEHLPRGYALVATRLHDGYDSARVLDEMMAYAKVGGAAVIRRLPSA